MLKQFIRSNKKQILFGVTGAILGGTAGFLYWKFVGCIDGTCAIWSNPYRSIFYGALLGSLLLSIFVPNSRGNQKSS